jgi:hypothetical protein
MVGVRVNSRGLFIPENEGGSCDVKGQDAREKIVMANNNCPPQVSHQCAHGGLFIEVVTHGHYNVCIAPIYLP